MDPLQLLSFGDAGWGDELVVGTLMTLALAAPSFLVGCALGTLAATVRERGHRVGSALVSAYTTFVRGIPELLVVYLIFFGGGQLTRWVAGLFGVGGEFDPNAFLAGLISLGIISGAYATEIMRGAFKAIDRRQVEAAHAFGWSPGGIFCRVVFPQLLRIALPGLGNVWLLTLKDTALISITGLVELMRAAGVATGSTRMPLYFYGAALLLYLLLSSGSNSLFTLLERHTRRGMRGLAAP
jgi:octopine/nopaline transport system permease protein